MNTRAILNFILLLVVLVLISFTILSIDRNKLQAIPLVSIDHNKITKITIPRAKGNIELVKHQGAWLVRQPYHTRAHTFRVEMLLNFSETLIDNSYTSSNDKLKSYGLDTPRATIIFNDQAVHFGKTNPVNNKRYIHTDQTITLIKDQVYTLISSQPSSFIDLNLLGKGQTITALQLPGLNFYKNNDSSWTSDTTPVPNSEKILTLIEHWQQAQAFAVHAYMKRKQIGNVTITLVNNETIELEVSDTDPWLILGHKQLGLEYHFDKALYSRLFLPGQATP